MGVSNAESVDANDVLLGIKVGAAMAATARPPRMRRSSLGIHMAVVEVVNVSHCGRTILSVRELLDIDRWVTCNELSMDVVINLVLPDRFGPFS